MVPWRASSALYRVWRPGRPAGGYDLVTGRMQAALDELANARPFPLIG